MNFLKTYANGKQNVSDSSSVQYTRMVGSSNFVSCACNSSPDFYSFNFFYIFLSQNIESGRIYVIILQVVLTPNLHLERLLESLSFSPTFYSVL